MTAFTLMARVAAFIWWACWAAARWAVLTVWGFYQWVSHRRTVRKLNAPLKAPKGVHMGRQFTIADFHQREQTECYLLGILAHSGVDAGHFAAQLSEDRKQWGGAVTEVLRVVAQGERSPNPEVAMWCLEISERFTKRRTDLLPQ